MNDWKQRLIAYIQKLDSGLSFYEAKDVVLQQLSVMEHDYSLVEKEDITTVQSVDVNTDESNRPLSIDELIKLFRSLFYGRQDVFAVRWDNEKSGTHGYAPKCSNEWDRKLCGKTQRIKGAWKRKDCINAVRAS